LEPQKSNEGEAMQQIKVGKCKSSKSRHMHASVSAIMTETLRGEAGFECRQNENNKNDSVFGVF
jgi:hypothetical protein